MRVVLEVIKGKEVILRSDVAKDVATLPWEMVERAVSKLHESALTYDELIEELARAVALLGHLDNESLVLTSIFGETVEELTANDEGEPSLRALVGNEARERHERLVDVFMPETVEQPAEIWHAKREAEMRQDLLTHYGFYGMEDLADLHGSKARNRHQLASRWQREGLIFGVPVGARTVFPAFQIDAAEGRPHKLVADVLAAMPRAEMSPWSVALWWDAPNPRLTGHPRPVELLGTAEEGNLITAAQALSEPEPL